MMTKYAAIAILLATTAFAGNLAQATPIDVSQPLARHGGHDDGDVFDDHGYAPKQEFMLAKRGRADDTIHDDDNGDDGAEVGDDHRA